MNEKLENPPAFPQVVPDEWRSVTHGMTLRDYFAAAALHGIIASGQNYRNSDGMREAAEAYAYADAMLAERDER